MASSAPDVLLVPGEPSLPSVAAGHGLASSTQASQWLRRPDVIATPGMLFVAIAMCWYWGLRPNWNPQRFVASQLLLTALVMVPTYVLYVMVRWIQRKPLQPVGGLAALRGFLADMALFTVMSWIYAHLKAGLLLPPAGDAWLAAWDRWLFAGHEPWTLCRQIVPAWGASSLHVVYMAFYPVLLASLFGLTLAGRRADAARLACALLLGYYIGVLSYHVLPSYGPAYIYASASPEFVSPVTHGTQQLLLRHVQEVRRDASTATIQPWLYIAAFPSLHVSHVLILAWYVRRQRMALVLASCFAVATALSTLYLGWHYACDWLGGVAVAVAAVALTQTCWCRPKCPEA